MFEDWAVIPLDLPPLPVDVDAFRAFVQSHCNECAFTDNQIRHIDYHARRPVIDGRAIIDTDDPRCADINDTTPFEWSSAFSRQFPELTHWFEALPFTVLHGVTLVTQTADVNEHMDIFGNHNSTSYYEQNRSLEPMFYRVIFCYPDDTTSRNQCFFITEEYGAEKQFIRLPDTTSAIALSTSTCYHGARHNPGHYKTTAAIYGYVDHARHLALLEKSLDRYRDYSIRLQQPGPVSGPAAEKPYRGAHG